MFISQSETIDVSVASGAATIAKAEDLVSANGHVGVPAMAVQKATPANTAGTDGDYEFLQMSAGRLWASATIDAALPAGTAYIGKTLPTDRDVTLHTAYAKKYYTNAGAVTDGIIWRPAAGTRWHVMSLYIQVSAAATVTLEDDKVGGDDPVWKAEFAANSGVFQVYPDGYPLASGEDAADLIVTTSAGNVYITVTGYEI